MPLLELQGLRIHYGGIEAVKGIDLHVEEGEIVTLIGGNGAGKTTTLKTISGLKRPTEGTIAFRGQRIEGMASHRVVTLGIGHAPEGRRIFGRMSVRENLEMGLSPILVEKIFEIVKAINDQGTTVLLVEQNAHMALSVAHRGYVIESGRIVLHDEGRALLGNDQVRKAYLGEE